MTERVDLSLEYIPAAGPEGLKQVLEHLLEKSKKNQEFAMREHYVLYQLGDQKSLIKVDTSRVPFHFLYCDLLGRPVTRIVKETIARFLWERCGERERYMRDSNGLTGA